MVRVGISVEGRTEVRFVVKVLQPYFLDRNIIIEPVDIRGNVSIDRVTHELQKMAFNFDFITTFYDFYGFKGKSKEETKESLELKIKENTTEKIQSKLIPYIQMYEFEGILFSSPDVIAQNLQGENDIFIWAADILKSFGGNPERINDSSQTSPSKRLENNTNYQKTTHGPNIASQVGITVIRDNCKGFDEWLEKLEKLI